MKKFVFIFLLSSSCVFSMVQRPVAIPKKITAKSTKPVVESRAFCKATTISAKPVTAVPWYTNFLQKLGFQRSPVVKPAPKLDIKQAQHYISSIDDVLIKFEKAAQQSLPEAITVLDEIPRELLNKPLPQILTTPKAVRQESGETILKRLIQMTGSPLSQKDYLNKLKDQFARAKNAAAKEKILQEFRQKKTFTEIEQYEIISALLSRGAQANYTGFEEIPGQYFVNAAPLKVAFDAGNVGAARALLKYKAATPPELQLRLNDELSAMRDKEELAEDPKRRYILEKEYELRRTICEMIKAKQSYVETFINYMRHAKDYLKKKVTQ